MDVFGLTDQGAERERNEDSILLNEGIRLFIVADGMGGHARGDVASKTAVLLINDFLEERIPQEDRSFLESDAIVLRLLQEGVEKASRGIYEYSQDLGQGTIMGTTVSLALIRNRKLYTAHVGDGRIYRLRKERIEKLTKDHSRVQELVDRGVIGEDEAAGHKLSHVLTRALGSGESVETDLNIFDIRRGDVFLMATDGLFRVMSVEGVKSILKSRVPAEKRCQMLLDETLRGEAPDNVSMIILDFRKRRFLKSIFS